MADLVDVENAFVALITQTLYPNSTSQPSVTGIPTIVYAGWPTSSQLDADLLALSQKSPSGRMHITVFPTKMERNTTRTLKPRVIDMTLPVQTLTLTINGQQVVVGGAVSAPQNVMLMVGYAPVVYPVKVTDSLFTVAAALAALVPGATSLDATITLPASANLTAARVGASGTAALEVRRQEKVFMITAWADTPAHRDAAIQAIDPVLAGTEFLLLADTTGGRLIYKSTNVDDMVSKANLYRRDLLYSVDYATLKTLQTTQITQTQLNVSGGVPPAQSTPITVYS